MSKIVKNIGLRQKPNDVIYTPKKVAELMIDLCDIKPDEILISFVIYLVCIILLLLDYKKYTMLDILYQNYTS